MNFSAVCINETIFSVNNFKILWMNALVVIRVVTVQSKWYIFDFKLVTRLLIAMLFFFFSAVSIKLHESGWAWLVAGNKLFLWKFSTMQLSVSVYVVLSMVSLWQYYWYHLQAHCQQLPLPPSGVASWHAELVTVCSATDSR